jgi:hypothetical protein
MLLFGKNFKNERANLRRQPYAEQSDIIIEALADYTDPTTGSTVQKALATVAEKNKNAVIIYTSGVWVGARLISWFNSARHLEIHKAKLLMKTAQQILLPL